MEHASSTLTRQVWTLQFEPATHVLRKRAGGRPHPDHKSSMRMKVIKAIDTMLNRPPTVAAPVKKKRHVDGNANYNVPNNWRTARSTTTVSFCDGTLAPAFVTVSHGICGSCQCSVLLSSVKSSSCQCGSRDLIRLALSRLFHLLRHV